MFLLTPHQITLTEHPHERHTITSFQVGFELLTSVPACVCVYSTLNITFISSPSGSALTNASLRGTALELKKEQAYTQTAISSLLHHTVKQTPQRNIVLLFFIGFSILLLYSRLFLNLFATQKAQPVI